MQKQNGFTLIELVVVIIILGILAVTAAPKFINLQSDARASTLQGVKGAIQSANSLVFAKAALAGEEKIGDDPYGDVDIGAADNAETQFGYLQATVAELNNAMDTDFGVAADDPDWVVSDVAGGSMTITQNGAPAEDVDAATACKLVYTQAEDENTNPTYVITDNGC
ncbi:type II secretion system protein [Shewanella sp. 10N.286.54.B9]|uniref:type II secretion system protein n=1 Tax=Shewanella sp. 10N.286.54.B9 TaxID=3229719 RepID=UPI00354FDD38